MRLSRAALEQARANLRLQHPNAKTDPDAQLGYKRTAGFDTLYAAVQIPLPVRNRNQGQIEAATVELKVADLLWRQPRPSFDRTLRAQSRIMNRAKSC